MKTNKKLLKQCKGKIRVAVLTAIRSEYDLLHPLIKALNDAKDFDVGVIVAGAHLTKLHNYSVKNIENDGFKIISKIKNFTMSNLGNTPRGRVESSGKLLQKISVELDKYAPDLFIFLGDREEALVAAMASLYLGIPSIHIAGGDNACPEGGDVDEEARHATTKLSHLHLTMAKAHENRLKKLGEERWRIKTVGNPGLDRIRNEPPIEINQILRKFSISKGSKYLILIYHAISSGVSVAPRELELCIKAGLKTNLDIFIGSPNSDPGYKDLLAVIEKYKSNPKIHVYNNFPRGDFISLLRNAELIIGNSSLGILEASFIGLPCINVGQRQVGRLAGNNVQFVKPKLSEISPALEKAIHDKRYIKSVKDSKSIYGDGFMVKKALEFIRDLPSKELILAKKITY